VDVQLDSFQNIVSRNSLRNVCCGEKNRKENIKERERIKRSDEEIR